MSRPSSIPAPKPVQPAPEPTTAGKPQFPEGSPVKIVGWEKYEAACKKQRNEKLLGQAIGAVVALVIFLLFSKLLP